MCRVAVALLVAMSVANAQNFEVASLKASQPGGRGGGIRPAPGGERYLATNVNLRLLIMVAYRLKNEEYPLFLGAQQPSLDFSWREAAA